jgi:hypothetical protein
MSTSPAPLFFQEPSLARIQVADRSHQLSQSKFQAEQETVTPVTVQLDRSARNKTRMCPNSLPLPEKPLQIPGTCTGQSTAAAALI